MVAETLNLWYWLNNAAQNANKSTVNGRRVAGEMVNVVVVAEVDVVVVVGVN